MKQATYNKDKHAWKRWPWSEIAFIAAITSAFAMGMLLAPVGWWL